MYTNQRLNLSKPWEGTRRTCQALEPDPGNLAVRNFRGASGNVRHGETVTPACNRKSGNGNPSPTAGRARFLSRQRASAPCQTTVVGVQGSGDRSAEITLGRSWMQQGLTATCKDCGSERMQSEAEDPALAHEPVGAKRAG